MDLTVLPIEGAPMPAEDVTDLRDVVDAINRLCDTMKTSDYEHEICEEFAPNDASPVTRESSDSAACVECSPEPVALVSPEQVTVVSVQTYRAERCEESPESTVSLVSLVQLMPRAESPVSLPLVLRAESSVPGAESPVSPVPLVSSAESPMSLVPGAESPVSPVPLVSSAESPVSLVPGAESPVSLVPGAESPVSLMPLVSGAESPVRGGCVSTGHVAAMRERFESMTRGNTPCPESDMLRNITPSPDALG